MITDLSKLQLDIERWQWSITGIGIHRPVLDRNGDRVQNLSGFPRRVKKNNFHPSILPIRSQTLQQPVPPGEKEGRHYRRSWGPEKPVGSGELPCQQTGSASSCQHITSLEPTTQYPEALILPSYFLSFLDPQPCLEILFSHTQTSTHPSLPPRGFLEPYVLLYSCWSPWP